MFKKNVKPAVSEKTPIDDNQEPKMFQAFIDKLWKNGTTEHQKQRKIYETAVMEVARKLADWVGGEAQAYLPMFYPWEHHFIERVKNIGDYIVVWMPFIPDYGGTYDIYQKEECGGVPRIPIAIVCVWAVENGWRARFINIGTRGDTKDDIRTKFEQEVSYEKFEEVIFECEKKNRERLTECRED